MKHRRLKIMLDVFRFGIACDFADREDFNVIAKTQVFDDYNCQILFNTLKPIPIASISHELLHALRYELNKRGFTGIDLWDEETLPYCLGYCMGKILDYCDKNKITLINNEKEIY